MEELRLGQLYGSYFGRRVLNGEPGQQDILRSHIKPATVLAGLGKIGWHFPAFPSRFVVEYGADIKVQQELLRHSTAQSTMNVSPQTVSEKNRIANGAVIVCSSGG